MQGSLPEETSSLAVGEEGWWPVAVPGGLEEQGEGERGPALSPASAEGLACFPENTSPGSGGRCLEDKDMFILKHGKPKKRKEKMTSLKRAGKEVASRRAPSSSSTGTSWTNCSHQRRDDCLVVHSWMSNLQRRPARYMTATAMISGSHCRDSMVHRLPGTQATWLQPLFFFKINKKIWPKRTGPYNKPWQCTLLKEHFTLICHSCGLHMYTTQYSSCKALLLLLRSTDTLAECRGQ